MNERVRRQAAIYGFVVLCPLLAVVARLLMAPLLHDELVFVTFLPAVFVCAIVCGFRPTLFCIAICAVAACHFFMPSDGILWPQSTQDWAALLVFITIGVGAALFGETVIHKTQAVERERERFRVTLASIADAVIVTNEHGVVSFMNDVARSLTKTNLAPCERRLLHEVLNVSPVASASQRESATDARIDLLRESSPHILTLVASDGTRTVIEKSSAPIRLADGSSLGNVCVFRDVSHRLEAEASLRVSEERLRLALDAGRTGTWEWQIRTNQITWSPTLERIHGIPEGSFDGTFEAYQRDIHPEDRERVLSSIQKTVETRGDHHIEYRIIVPDGSTRWVEARGRLYFDADGQPVRMIGACTDVTERKRIDLSLRFLVEASKVLSALIDYQTAMHEFTLMSVPHFAAWCCVDMVKPDGSLHRVAVSHRESDNRRTKMDSAHSAHNGNSSPVRRDERPARLEPADEAIASGPKPLLEAVLHAEVNESLLREMASNEAEYEWLAQLHLNSYMCVPLKINHSIVGVLRFATAVPSRPYSFDDFAMAKNLADRAAVAIENARLYEELQQADRRKDEFLAMLAHELRNPLVPIRSGLDVLRMDPGTDHETVRLMQEQVEHVVRLVDDLLDVSRIMRGRVELRCETVELAPLVNRAIEAVKPFVRKQGHDLRVHMPARPLYLSVDPVRIVQVLTNLLNNAAKYMDPGGKIDVTVEATDDSVQVRVQDYGLGIDPDLLPHVFDLFTQASRSLDRSQGGLGIGLTLVQSLVVMHGGTVKVHSDGPGTGSTFTVWLPLCEPPQVMQRPSVSSVGLEQQRILLVDDNRSATVLITKLLEKMGVRDVMTANDGHSALDLILQQHPSLVLLDIGLPGMDGYEVGRRVRELREYDDVLLVALTGYGQEADRRRAIEIGFDEHLTKPPSMDQIRSILCHPKLTQSELASAQQPLR